jgi:Bacterial TSP3 repeat
MFVYMVAATLPMQMELASLLWGACHHVSGSPPKGPNMRRNLVKNVLRNFAVPSVAIATVTLAHANIAFADPIIELYPTGVNDTGALLPVGTKDPHWIVSNSTDAANPGPDVFVGDPLLPFGGGVLIGGPWVANTATGQWLWLRSEDYNTNGGAVFTFAVKVDLTGYVPSTANINLKIAADDEYNVSLNGTLLAGKGPGGYSAITTENINSGFAAGINTLTFRVTNSGGGPTGFLVSQFDGTATIDTADADADGLNAYIERIGKTDPTKADTDGDGISDGLEDKNKNGFVDPGESDPTKADTDSDGIADGVEDANKNGVVDAGETDPRKLDTDGDGISDGVEDGNKNGVVDAGETDPRKADTDADGIPDGDEDTDRDGIYDPATDFSNPLVKDTDGGGVPDGTEKLAGTDPKNATDDATIKDTDGDGIPDATETRLKTDPLNPDTDGDGIKDGAEVGGDVNAPRDTDGDGKIDALDADDDGDSIPTKDELGAGGAAAPVDSDADGKPDYLDSDDDNDTIPTKKEIDDAKAAKLSDDVDGDGKKNWLDTDADNDGKLDKDEPTDADKNGIPDYLESSSKDTDGDGLPDSVELKLGTNPNNADSDGDGIKDGVEVGGDPNKPVDSDGDGKIDALDADDDDDSIPTKKEVDDAKAAKLSDDVDGDGKKNWLDTDADNDGTLDKDESTDAEGNGVPDYLEAGASVVGQANEDGKLEGGGVGCSTSVTKPSQSASMFTAMLLGLAAIVGRAKRKSKQP